MFLKEKKKLSKYINKYYQENNQVCYITTFEIMNKDSSSLDICLYNKKKSNYDKYLFEIINYNAFKDFEILGNRWNKNYYYYITVWNGVKAACSPYYMNRVFCLPKFTGITKEDILKAVKKFFYEELKLYFIFNFEFIGNH